jgi:serine protease Do
MERIQYSRMQGEVRAIDEALPGDLGKKIGSLGKAFVVLAKKVGPSVVHIDTRGTELRQNDVFGQQQQYETEGEASGVVVDPAGYIVTNNHVVENATNVKVTLSDGASYDHAEVVGRDPGYDLAVIKIPKGDLIAADWGDSDTLDVGEMVLAIGNPFGLDRSVTFGIVSAKNRRGVGNSTNEFLQTDAAVNPGNSGGPLINMGGQIVGINTAIVGPTYQGISFALPSNVAKTVYEQLKQHKAVVRGYLGVVSSQLNPAAARQLGLKSGEGVVVMSVSPGSPAEQAGIRKFDIIVEWDGHPIEDPKLLSFYVARSKVGGKVPVKLIRPDLTGGGRHQEMHLDVSVAQRPEQLGP